MEHVTLNKQMHCRCEWVWVCKSAVWEALLVLLALFQSFFAVMFSFAYSRLIRALLLAFFKWCSRWVWGEGACLRVLCLCHEPLHGQPKEAGGGSVASHGSAVGIASQMDPLLVWQKVLSPRMFLGTPTEADVGSVDDWPLCFLWNVGICC